MLETPKYFKSSLSIPNDLKVFKMLICASSKEKKLALCILLLEIE